MARSWSTCRSKATPKRLMCLTKRLPGTRMASSSAASLRTALKASSRWAKLSTPVSGKIFSSCGTATSPSCSARKTLSARNLSSTCKSTSRCTQHSWDPGTRSSVKKTYAESLTTSSTTLTREDKIFLARVNFCSFTHFLTSKTRCSTQLSKRFAPKSGLLICATSSKSSSNSTCQRTSRLRSTTGTQTLKRSN